MADYHRVHAESVADPDAFWLGITKELIDWETPPTMGLEGGYSGIADEQFTWYEDGRLNATISCLDRHLESRGDKTAILWEGDEPGDVRRISYSQLHTDVCRFSNALENLGVGSGDRVIIYMGMVPEAAIAMLACARIGAVHSVVFGGFSPESLADRNNDAQAKVLITADGGWRRGAIVPLKANADLALESSPTVENVVVVRRGGELSEQVDSAMLAGRDHWYHDLTASASSDCPAESMDAEDILFILYTSGTTGTPKGVVHTTGGYLTQVAATTKVVFDLQDDDVYWCTADVGWVTGHSYIVYGPLANGARVMMYEGSPDTPDWGRLWQICEKYGVTVFYTAPTAIRAFMKWGDQWPGKYDLSKLRLLGTVGEPINPEAWVWYHEVVGGERCPIVDTWWQTETGAIMITPLPGVTRTKPGTATLPFPGIDVTIKSEAGDEIPAGYLAITSPWPSMLRTIWGDDQRYQDTYWSKWDGVYFPGDGSKRDEDGFFWILGRVDDVLNVAGHRIGTMEVESALVDHPAVAESAVVGKSHDIKGQSIAAFVTLKHGRDGTDELLSEIRDHVGKKIGAIAKPEIVVFTADLPKTRSGKIMRRLLRDIAEGRTVGDTTTLADPAVVARLQEMHEEDED